MNGPTELYDRKHTRSLALVIDTRPSWYRFGTQLNWFVIRVLFAFLQTRHLYILHYIIYCTATQQHDIAYSNDALHTFSHMYYRVSIYSNRMNERKNNHPTTANSSRAPRFSSVRCICIILQKYPHTYTCKWSWV